MHRYSRALVLFILCFLGATAFFGFLGQANASETPNYISKFPLPYDGSPRALVQTEGKYWFTAPGINSIGSFEVISTAEYTFTFYTIPTTNSEPYDLAAGNGIIWFTELAGNRLGKLDIVSGVITEYEIPTANSTPTGIDVTTDGTVWFVQQTGNKIGMFDPVLQSFTEIPYPLVDAGLKDISVTNTGQIVWVTAASAHLLSAYTIATGNFSHFPTIQFGFPPYTPSQVALDSTNNIWVSTHDGLIGRLSPSTVQFFRWYRVAPADSALDGLLWRNQDGYNQLWFTESNTGYAGQLLVTSAGSTVSKWRFPISLDSSLYGITQDESNTIWIANSGNHQIIRWEAPYLFSTYLPLITK